MFNVKEGWQEKYVLSCENQRRQFKITMGKILIHTVYNVCMAYVEYIKNATHAFMKMYKMLFQSHALPKIPMQHWHDAIQSCWVCFLFFQIKKDKNKWLKTSPENNFKGPRLYAYVYHICFNNYFKMPTAVSSFLYINNIFRYQLSNIIWCL